MIRGIGINCDDDGIDGHLDRLENELQRAQHAGFDAYEFSLPACNVVRCGNIAHDELERLKAITACYPLHYTLHAPCSLRLTETSGLHRQVFISCLRVAAAIGADVMVYHSAQIALRPADQDTAPLPDAEGLRRLWQIETAALKEMAAIAQDLGITIAVENRDPHLWEIAALRRHGRVDAELIIYHQGMRLDLLAAQMQEIASPHVGICLDVGHAALAAPYWPESDYLKAIQKIAPYVMHLHFHDNFGRLDDWAESLSERLIFGEADNHLPPGWGTIPLTQTLSILHHAGYCGWLILELRPRYSDSWHEVATNVRAMLTHIAQGG